jgi:hypothetical protein
MITEPAVAGGFESPQVEPAGFPGWGQRSAAGVAGTVPYPQADGFIAPQVETPAQWPVQQNVAPGYLPASGQVPFAPPEEQVIEAEPGAEEYLPPQRIMRPVPQSGAEVWYNVTTGQPAGPQSSADVARMAQAQGAGPAVGEGPAQGNTPAPGPAPSRSNIGPQTPGQTPSLPSPPGSTTEPGAAQPGAAAGEGGYSEPPRSPDELKRVTEIAPYYDYEPDPAIRAEDPCRNICPPLGGGACKTYEEGENPPACPEELGLGHGEYRERELAPSTFTWAASNLWHYPLYFEDPALERYGHTYPDCIQPFASVGRFSAQLAGLPYQMAIDPICKRRYTLGWYRPGECAPKLHYQVPWNTQAAAVQAGVMTGLFYAFP